MWVLQSERRMKTETQDSGWPLLCVPWTENQETRFTAKLQSLVPHIAT